MARPGWERDRLVRTLLTLNARNVARPPSLRLVPRDTLYRFAAETGIAFSWVHKTIEFLRSQGWMDREQTLRVREALPVYEWWLQNRGEPRVESFSVQDPLQMAARLLHKNRIPNAITTYYAENFYQKHLFPTRLDTYVSLDHVHVARKAVIAAGGLLGGTNFRLFRDDSRVVDDKVSVGLGPARLDYAPVAQVILDLMWERGSAREAAEMMLEAAYPDARPRVH